MPKSVLVVTRRLPPAIEARARRDYDARLNAHDAPMSGAALVHLAKESGAAAVLCCPTDRVDATVVEALPLSVRVLGTFSVGYDHIDIEACKARELPVVNTPDVLSIATAEIAFLLIVASARRAGEGERLVRSGRWTGWGPTQLLGTQVHGKRLGIFGMGRIGRELARMAAAFDMQVHYRDVARLPPELERGAIWHDDERSFLAACDILSLHAPAGIATCKWLNAQRLGLLPRGAIVVNAARGTLIDDVALIDALRTGQVGFAGLDVYEGEPALHSGYRSLEHVILLPHLGSATVETRNAMGNVALDGIDAVLAGRLPANIVGR